VALAGIGFLLGAVVSLPPAGSSCPLERVGERFGLSEALLESLLHWRPMLPRSPLRSLR